ncbi:MAG: hypothetical protein FVQ85_13180 [Planctomycetes bacterium]|nr:hypothetical protein [Planctomycetota bacterium]
MNRKKIFFILCLMAAMIMVAFSVSAAEKINTDPKQQLPDPDTKPATIDKPVKVFILMGQSNMLGFGKVGPEEKNGTLEYLTKKKGKYAHLVDDHDNWTQRKDVRYVQVMHRRGSMATLRNEWLTVKGNVGPELQFGHIMGHVLEEPVLVLKSCIGNRSLGWDLLPPGSERFTYDGFTYAEYGNSTLKWPENASLSEIDALKVNWYAGKQYDDDIASAKKVLADIGKYYPGAKSYEVAGFVWWQGHKDQNPAHASRYEQNLVHLIKTLRKDFNAPDAKFVLATIAFGGWDLKGPGLTVANAQLAVSGEKGKYPEFAGNVKTMEARDFWRDKSVSPSGAGYHYNNNAETYMEVGDALGRGMVQMLTKPKKKAFNEEQTELQDDFMKLKFGMFLHYNMATYKGVQWVAGYPKPSDFNPGGKVDTDAWADAAVAAGMKYGVLTAKHVAGFCLWDSKYTTYDVMHPDCTYQKDLVAQFIKSFKSRGLKVGLYYCWRNPGFGDPKKHKVLPPECDPAKHTLKEQNEFQMKQIAELIEKYPDVFYIWNDGLDPEVMSAEQAADFFKSTRPNVLVSTNWWDWAKKGTPYADIAVKEMRHFPETNKAPGETCWKLEQKWFWGEGFRASSAKGVMGHMDKAYSRNSNFLLNVGPDKNGKIIESSIKTLAEIGKLWDPNATPDLRQ